MPPELGTPAEWLRYARADLALAAIPLPESVRYEQLCFHAQQAAQEAPKAVPMGAGVGFPRTHSIAALLDLLPEEVAMPAGLDAAAVLTGYATFMRYPLDAPELDEARYRGLLGLAEAVVAWAETLIAPQAP
jgi:HEPN domain-containing protein